MQVADEVSSCLILRPQPRIHVPHACLSAACRMHGPFRQHLSTARQHLTNPCPESSHQINNAPMADSPDSSPKQHCWECRRRCLVCDFTTPSCKRCIASGVACPGYGTVKPVRFQWLPPGKVKSRRRKPVDTAEPAEKGALKSKTKPAAKSVPLAPPAQTGELAQTSAIRASFPREPPRLAQNFNLRVLTESLEYCECLY